jgi:hypothetical protein
MFNIIYNLYVNIVTTEQGENQIEKKVARRKRTYLSDGARFEE